MGGSAILDLAQGNTATLEATEHTLADFDSVVRAHQQRVYRTLLGILRDEDTAETLTQETFLRAHAARNRYRGESSVSTWLISIAVNLARDHMRSRRLQFWRLLRRGNDELPQLADRLPEARSTPEQQLVARREVDRLWRAASELSPNQRLAFTLRFAEEMEIAELAAAMNMKGSTVKVHLHRAIANVRKKMNESAR